MTFPTKSSATKLRGTSLSAAALPEALLFTAVALWVTWPLAANLSTCVPLGCEQVPTVPLLNLWTLWWNVDRINHAYSGYWSAPIFYPAQDAFAYSEPQLLAGQVAWLLWRVLPSPECVYNVILLGHLVLNGWSFFKLLRAWHLAWPTSLVAALMCETMPMVHWQLGIIQLVPLWGIIWTIRFLDEFTRRPSWKSCIGLGLSVACTYLLCSYYGVMLSMLLLPATPLLATRRMWKPSSLWYVSATAGLILVCILPVAFFQWRTVQQQGIVPPRELVKQLSVGLPHFLRTPWPQLLPVPGVEAPTAESPWALSPGTLKLIGAVLGGWYGLRRKRSRRRTMFLLAVAILAAGLAMAPLLAWNEWSIDDWLMHFPGYAQLRNIYRFAIFTQLTAIALIAFGLQWFWRTLSNLRRSKVVSGKLSNGICLIAWSAASIVLLVEMIPGPPSLYRSGQSSPAGWIHWIRDNSNDDDVLAIFPFPATDLLTDYVPTAHWMYWQRHHGRRMINGYSGFFPASVSNRELRMRRFPDQDVLAELARIGVDLLVVHGELNNQLGDRTELASTAFTLKRVAWDRELAVGIYRIGSK